MKKTLTKAMAMTLAFILLFGSAAAGIGGFADVLDTISIRASADDTEYTDEARGVKFTAGSAIVITGYTQNLQVGADGSYTIPAKVSNGTTEYNVTQIGYGAFKNCKSIKTLTIPAKINFIGGGAFDNCTSLREVTYLTNNCKIGDGSLTTAAFTNDSAVKKVTFGTGVTKTPNSACKGMTGLETVVFKDEVSEIENYTFQNCSSLESVNFSNVERIGWSAFEGCSSLNNPVFSNNLKYIDGSAFAGCTSITEITIPESVTEIGGTYASMAAFGDCTSLREVTFLTNNCKIGDGSSTTAAFTNDSAVKKVTFGPEVTKIPNAACKGMTGLKEVYFNGKLTSIGSYNFKSCTNLSDIYCATMTENYWNSKVKPNIGSENDVLSSDDVTYHWGTIPVYTVTFDVCGHGTAPATQYVEYGSAATYQKPTASGYTFINWYKDPGYNEVYGFGPVTENITVYAKWKADASTKFTLTYNANGGSGAPANQTGNGSIALSTVRPTREGYTFKGWATTSTATTAQYQPGAKFNLTKNTVLFAVWQKNAPVQPDVSKAVITAPSGTKTVNWKYKAHLFASASNLPDGYKVVWYEGKTMVSDGSDYTSANLTSNHTYTAKIVDGSGKIVSTSAQEKTVTITVKTDFISKLISFFSRLFVGDVTDIR